MSINANTALIKSGARGGRATVRFIGTGANLVVVANSTSNSDIGNPANDQFIVGASIVGMHFCLAGNGVTVARVNSTVTVVVANLQGSGFWTAATGWQGDQRLLSQNVVVTFGTSGLGTIELELSKIYPGGNPPDRGPAWTSNTGGVNI